ncbi:hypothetical protein OMK73_04125 [Cupriavidus sp. D39]|nr:hypothetical protein [Cupriavidus sp. D39]MCY0853115.1 hypothetical protein [Cupriavidus sp. D39]
MPTQPFDVIIDKLTVPTEVRQERLRAFRNPETTHPSLAFTRGLMAVFGPVIYSSIGFDEVVLGARQLAAAQ